MPVKRRRKGRRVPKRVAKKQKVHTSRRSNDAHSESSSESENSSVSSSQSDHSEGEDNGGGMSKEIGGEGSLSVKDNEEDGRISKLQEQLSFVMPAKCIYVGGVQRYREGI